MISSVDAMKQLERLSGLDFFPRSEDQGAALRELRVALESASTVEIAAKVTTNWLANYGETPKPSDIRLAIKTENERGQYWKPEWANKPLATPQPKKNIWDMTADEIDALPDYESGLPTGKVPREHALAAWKKGGLKAFEEWRSEHTRRSK